MTHSDPDVLALLALGETDISDVEAAHLLECPECRDEVERLRRVTRLARENGPLDPTLEEPSPRVWERIRHQIDADEEPAGVQVDRVVASGRTSRRSRSSGRSRRPLVIGLVAAAAVVVIVAGIAGSVAVFAPRPDAGAHATLAALPAWSGSRGEATMRRLPGGSAELIVNIDSPAATADGSYCEVWLMNTELTKLVAVGVLNDGKGRFEMPPGIVAADYPVVDVSLEHVNGQVGHAGDSVVRGTLTASG